MALRTALRSATARSGRSGRARVEDLVGLFAADCETEDQRRSVAEAWTQVAPLAGAAGTSDADVVAKLAVRLAVEAHVEPGPLARAAARAADMYGLSRLRIVGALLGDPELLELPLNDLIELSVTVLDAASSDGGVSLWREDAGGATVLVHGAGCPPLPSTAHRAASALADGEEAPPPATATVLCWRRPIAVIVWNDEDALDTRLHPVAERAARLLGASFERVSLIESNVERATSLVSSSERRLTRLSFDLHDGPLQDVALMSARIADLRRRLDGLLPSDGAGRGARAALEDLAGLIEFLDNDLRDLASSLDAPVLVQRPFADVVDTIVRKFTARCSTEVEVSLVGDIDAISSSQRIALARIVQEALTNVSDHSGASCATVAIHAGPRRVEAMIEDDGGGFDVDEALRIAARGGRMGLLGMLERVRLLGGACTIDSRAGGGTRISLTMARWEAGITAHAAPA